MIVLSVDKLSDEETVVLFLKIRLLKAYFFINYVNGSFLAYQIFNISYLEVIKRTFGCVISHFSRPFKAIMSN